MINNMKENDESQLYNPTDDLDESVEDSEAYELNLAEETYYEPVKSLRVAIIGCIGILLFCIVIFLCVKRMYA